MPTGTTSGEAPAPASARGTNEPSPKSAYDDAAKKLDGEIDALLAIPEAPAAFAIGVSGDAVAHTGDLRDATAHFVTMLGPGGKIAPGAAVEVAPFRPLFEDQTIAQWRAEADWGHRVVDSVRFSLATAADPAAHGASDAPPLVGAGFRLSLLDERDYRRNDAFLHAAHDAIAKCFPPPGSVTPSGPGGASWTRVTQSSDACAGLDDTIQKTLAQRYLKGARLEIASAMVVADRAVADGAADWRSTRVWAAFDEDLGAPLLGLGADMQWRDDANGDKVRDVRLGGRFSLEAGPTQWSVAGAYARLAQGSPSPSNALDFSGSLTLKVGALAVVRGAVQGTRDFDARVTGLTTLISIATATGETLFEKVGQTAGTPQ